MNRLNPVYSDPMTSINGLTQDFGHLGLRSFRPAIATPSPTRRGGRSGWDGPGADGQTAATVAACSGDEPRVEARKLRWITTLLVLLLMLLAIASRANAQGRDPTPSLVEEPDSGAAASLAAVMPPADEAETAARATALTDPLGIDLASVGLAAGSRPCAGDEHVASVVDAHGRYVAFCKGTGGEVSTFQVARADQPLFDFDGMSPLEAFRALTPDTVAVPAALADRDQGHEGDGEAEVRDRGVAAGGVVYQAPAALDQQLPAVPNACSSSAYFKSKYCSVIESWADPADWSDQSHWCSVAPVQVVSQRTATAEGVIPNRGRQILAACGTNVTRLQRWYLGGVSPVWVLLNVDTIQPNHVIARSMFHTNYIEWNDFGNPYPARDLRFRMEPRTGAWYRHTGGFVLP